MNRWFASRWLILSVLAMAAACYFVVAFPEARETAIRVFGEIVSVALVGGHATNVVRDYRTPPRARHTEENEAL